MPRARWVMVPGGPVGLGLQIAFIGSHLVNSFSGKLREGHLKRSRNLETCIQLVTVFDTLASNTLGPSSQRTK